MKATKIAQNRMAFNTNLKRIIRGGATQFWRNGAVSLSSILVMTITLFVVVSVVLLQAILTFSLQQIQNKVDVNVYFTQGVSESAILDIVDILKNLPEVAEVTYSSEDEELLAFEVRHQGDSVTLQALEELGENPFGAAIAIRARETSQYETVIEFFETGKASEFINASTDIEKINYYQNANIIERLGRVISSVTMIGYVISAILIIVSIIITFNTIRIAIYIAREDIRLMRLVGAPDRIIQGPFIIAGIIYGLVASVLTLVLMYPTVMWLTKHTSVLLGGLNLFSYYIANLTNIAFLVLSSGILIGVMASFIAVRKYVRV